jgi:hypothetical protein
MATSDLSKTFSWTRVGQAFAALCGVGLLVLGYALFIEPAWIEVRHVKIAAPLEAPIKIAHLSDLHTRGLGRVERRLLELLDREQPDLIVITGDSLSCDWHVPQKGEGSPGALTEGTRHRRDRGAGRWGKQSNGDGGPRGSVRWKS